VPGRLHASRRVRFLIWRIVWLFLPVLWNQKNVPQGQASGVAVVGMVDSEGDGDEEEYEGSFIDDRGDTEIPVPPLVSS
jgi:hypothetical protein